MKTKILLIVMVILFAVSCANNNPANPVSSSNNLGNTSGTVNKSNNNIKDDIIIEGGEPVKYKLNVTYIVENLDTVGKLADQKKKWIYI